VVINISLANNQIGSLNNYADELRTACNNLQSYKKALNNNWIAQEMIYINLAIEKILSELGSLSSDLHGEANDINSSAKEIKAAEEKAAKEKAEREAREKAQRDANAK
jgi:uncharacterized membrane protein YukC